MAPKRKYQQSQSNFVHKKSKSNVNKLHRVAALIARGSEKKYIESVFAAADPGNAGTVTLLNGVAEGTDYSNRVGRKCRSHYLQYDLQISATVGAISANPVAYTIHFVLDRQPNGATATVANMVDLTSATATFALKNVQNYADRFKFLKSEQGCLYTGGGECLRIKGFIPLAVNPNEKEDLVQFQGAGAGAPSTNAILAMMAQNGAANSINVTGVIRYVFTDTV